jgi:hypothetical protein
MQDYQAIQSKKTITKKENMDILLQSNVKFSKANGGETILFREKDKPLVDFYPSRGKWRAQGRMFEGGAAEFLKWYGGQQ